MFDFLRRRKSCEAEELLDKNVRFSQELSEALTAMAGDVTTVFDRRKHEDVTVPAERRKAAG